MKSFSVSATLYLLSILLTAAVILAQLNKQSPVIALVPAAWHTPIHYELYFSSLHVAGYDTVTAQLPSCGSSNPKAQSVAADAAFIIEQLLMPSIDKGREVLVVMHSYGGGPGAMAAKGLSVAERRAAGKPGGIIGLIFVAAFVANDGQSLLSGSGGQYAPWVIQYVSCSLYHHDSQALT